MEYIIYCDESVSDGKYYTDFFGGVLVRNADYDAIKETLDAKKAELGMNGEIKWVKVTSNYLDKYKQMVSLFFSFLKEDWLCSEELRRRLQILVLNKFIINMRSCITSLSNMPSA